MEEPEYGILVAKIARADVRIIGAPTALETALVLGGRIHQDVRQLLAALLLRFGIEVVSFTRVHYDAAIDASLRYGKGRHPAALNFGDCMSYAVASVSGFPLLYTGNDFAQTDIEAA